MIYVLVLGALAVFVAIVWIFFVVPLGNQMHERRLEMIRRKIERKEQQGEKQGKRPPDDTSAPDNR